MKHILFFVFFVLFIWIVLVPPEGMTKLSGLTVEVDYSKSGDVTAQVKLRGTGLAEINRPMTSHEVEAFQEVVEERDTFLIHQ